ncbi:MAG: hypothetical protein ABEJ79_12140 [Halolamina sp.]
MLRSLVPLAFGLAFVVVGSYVFADPKLQRLRGEPVDFERTSGTLAVRVASVMFVGYGLVWLSSFVL